MDCGSLRRWRPSTFERLRDATNSEVACKGEGHLAGLWIDAAQQRQAFLKRRAQKRQKGEKKSPSLGLSVREAGSVASTFGETPRG